MSDQQSQEGTPWVPENDEQRDDIEAVRQRQQWDEGSIDILPVSRVTPEDLEATVDQYPEWMRDYVMELARHERAARERQ